ncbi:MAG: arsenate reductase ArsC [Fidelibacterota bacterium]
MTQRKKVLFLCTGNSCRSQMAEGLLRHLAGDRFQVFSAGTHPTRIHPMTIRIMKEWGIDVSNHTANHVDEYLDHDIDIVITVCDNAEEICPVFPGAVKRIHWGIPDPFSGWSEDDRFMERYRTTRNLIRERIEEFLTQNRVTYP